MPEHVSGAWIEEAWEAARDLGLRPGETDFLPVPGQTLWALASYGWPHFPAHWTFGRDYWRIRQQNMAGLARLMELVVPGDPCLAYLDESNPIADQKMVVCHVAGHCHLFNRHPLFQDLSPDLSQVFWSAAERTADYVDREGIQAVEAVLDAALAVADQAGEAPAERPLAESSRDPRTLTDQPPRGPVRRRPPRFSLPTADLIGFVARNGPLLEDWERDLLEVIRLNSAMRRSIRMTKIVHEGFASWAHHRLLAEVSLTGEERVTAARSQALVGWTSPMNLNPYDLGFRLFSFIEEAEGREAMVEEAGRLTDGEFLGRHLTSESVRALDLYAYHWEESGRVYQAIRGDDDWRGIRDGLVDAVVEQPPRVMVVSVEGDYTLVLRWDDPAPPDENWAQLTLDAVGRLWGAPVRLEREDGPPLHASGSEGSRGASQHRAR